MSAPASSTASGVAVTVRDLSKSFGEHAVLRAINIEVRPGEVFVIMGPSGSGKSVLLRHIIGLELPDTGDILIQGASVHDPATRDRHHMAMVFQGGALLNSLTVAENTGLYLAEHGLKSPEEIARIVAEKLELVGLTAAAGKLPGELSGGMRKRAAIARALVADPHLILYDEPTSELDPLMAVTVGHEIVRLNRRTGATSLVVSHDRDLAFGIAHRMAIMLDGEIHCCGTPAEIRKSADPQVQAFLNADFKFTQPAGTP